MPDDSNRIDPIRLRTVADGPEEKVRQAFLTYLIEDRGIPRGLISVESGVSQAAVRSKGVRRADIVVHDRRGRPWMLIECKAPDIRLDQQVFNQAAGYNRVVDAPYLLVTNGKRHLCADLAGPDPQFIKTFPDFPK